MTPFVAKSQPNLEKLSIGHQIQPTGNCYALKQLKIMVASTTAVEKGDSFCHRFEQLLQNVNLAYILSREAWETIIILLCYFVTV